MEQLTERQTDKVQSVFYTYSDLIEDEDQAELISIRDALTLQYFRVGDIALKYISGNARKNALRVNAKMIYDAVGFFAGKTGRTVRYYSENAAFYDSEVRESYKELPFAYFDLARNFGERWREVLDYASENIGANYDTIEYYARRAFIWDKPLGEPLPEYTEQVIVGSDKTNKSVSDREPMYERPTIDESVKRKEALALLYAVDELAMRAERITASLDLDDGIHLKLIEGIKTIRECIPVISRMVRDT